MSCPKPLPDSGEIAQMTDCAVHGVDEMLQKGPCRASAKGMRTIVAA